MDSDIKEKIDIATRWCMEKWSNMNPLYSDPKEGQDIQVMIFISLNTYVGTLIQLLDGEQLHSSDVSYITSSIMTMAGHYRYYFFKRYRINPNTFMYFNLTNHADKAVTGYTDYLKRRTLDHGTHNISCIREALNMCKDIVRYIPKLYVINADCEVSLVPSYIINKHMEYIIDEGQVPKLTESYSYMKILLMSKDVLELQLFCSLRFYDIESGLMSPSNKPRNSLQAMYDIVFGKKTKICIDSMILTTFPLFIALMGGNSNKGKSNLSSYFKINGKKKLLEMARSALLPLDINIDIDQETYTRFIQPLLKETISYDEVRYRLHQFSMPFQYIENSYVIDQTSDEWKVNLRDFSSFEQLNEGIFKDCPIDIGRVMCTDIY